MKNLLTLIIMLLTINFTYAIETTKEQSTVNWYNLNNTLAYSILKNLPDYPILYSQEIISEAKERFEVLSPILFCLTANLVIKTFFNMDVDFNIITFIFKFLLLDSLYALIKPTIVTDDFFNIIFIYMQIFTDTAMGCYAITDSYSMIPPPIDDSKVRLTSLISFFTTSCIVSKKLYDSMQSKKLHSENNKQNPRMILLNKLVKKNIPMFLYSTKGIKNALENDRYFTKINKWVALHKSEISLYNLYSADDNSLIKQQKFANNNKIVEAKDNYYILPKKYKSCININLGLGFFYQPSKEVINKEDIVNILSKEGNYIIEANKERDDYNISRDLQNDKHQYIVMINHQKSHYLLVGLQLTSNSWKTTLVNKLLWPVFFKGVPFNEYMTLTAKFKNTQEIMDIIGDVTASFKECNSRMGVFRLKNIKKEDLAKVYGIKKVRFIPSDGE
jgi:hypothetical protein